MRTGVGIRRTNSFRFYNEETKMFLHLSGKGEVRGRAFAWFGSQRQAIALRSKIIEEKGIFAYELIPAD